MTASILHLCTASPQRENLDSKHSVFRMFLLWQDTIERNTIAKLNENF
jgi:hypothetical protein